MPTYEYACEKCGHEFEREQRITEEPVKKCPSCRSSRVKRLISSTSFVLKGGGWYSDLYSSGKSKTDAGKSESSGTSESATKSDVPAKEASAKSSSDGDAKPAAGGSGGDKKKPAKTAAA